MTSLKRALPLTVAAFLVLASQALAVPLPGVTQSFGISPARRLVIGRPGMALTPTTVTNGTTSAYRVSVFPAILSQGLSGAFSFAETPAALSNSKLALTASPDGFTMPPGSTQAVALHWNLLPPGQKWLAMGVVFQGTAVGQTGAVHVVTRLLSVDFLSLPGLNTISGAFTGVFAQQLSPRVLQVLARVKNTGNTFGAPSDGHLTIRDGLGDVVYGARWTGDVILPGAQRDFPIDVRKLLPAGNYTATVSMRFGRRQSSSTSFVLVGPNQLPTPAITIQNFNATGVLGEPANVTARIVSDGTAPAALTLHLFLGRASAAAAAAGALATGQVAYGHLVPGSVTKLSRRLGGHLRKGSYDVFATWTDPTGVPHTLQAQFTTTAARSFLQRFWSFIKNLLILWVVLLVLGVLALIAALIRRLTNRQREIEAELAAARELLQAAGLDVTAAAERPPGPAPTRANASRPPRPKRPPANGDAAAKRRSTVKTSGAAGESKTERTARVTPKANRDGKGATPKPSVPGRATARRANGAKGNGTTPTRTRTAPNGGRAAKPENATAAAPEDGAAKRLPTKPTPSKRIVAKPNAARTNGLKPTAPKSNAAKTTDAKTNSAKTNSAKTNRAKTNRAKATAAKVSTSGAGEVAASEGSRRARTSPAKAPPQKRPPAKRAAPKTSASAPSQSTIATNLVAPSDNGPAQVAASPPKADRAAELLKRATRSHALRPNPTRRDER